MNNVLRIAICDDESIIAEQVEEKCINFFTEKQIAYQITIFHNGNELIASSDQFDIYLLDIEIPGTDGLRVAEYLQKNMSDTTIVFLTSYGELMKYGYQVNAFRFLMKPINDLEFSEALSGFLKKNAYQKKYLVKTANQTLIVYEKDIYFIESLGDEIAISYKDALFICKDNLITWKKNLSSYSFVQVSRTHIVNLGYIIGIDSSKILMDNNKTIMISRRRKAEVNRMFKNYILDNAEYLAGRRN